MAYSLFALFVVLQIADAYTTLIILKNGRELNPVMAWLFERFGVAFALAVFKSAICLAVYFTLAIPVMRYILFALIVIYAFVVHHNFLELKK